MRERPRILALFGARVIFGAERENIESLAALRDQGCEVLCIVRDEPWNDHIVAALSERGLASERVPFIDGWLQGWRLWILARNPVAFVKGNWRLLTIARKFQPTHIHAFNPLYVLSFIAALGVIRAPMIYRSVDAPVRHRWFWRLVWAAIIARTARFVALSKFVARQLESSGVGPAKISLIYGCPPVRTHPESAPSVDGNFYNVVFVGQIAEHKGPHLLIEAIRNLAPSYPDLRLLIAGPITSWRGDEWARALRDQVNADKSLEGRVMFLGKVDGIPSLLRQCQLLVAPSLWEEPLGLVVMEAKEAAIPSSYFLAGDCRRWSNTGSMA